MVWCSYCVKDQQAERDDINGFTCCTGCGRVLDDNVYGSDPTFTKNAGGQSQVDGNFVKDGQSSFGRLGAGAGRILGYQSDSHEKTLAKGKHEIVEILERLSIRPRDDTATQAHRFYTIALERNFTRGRRTQQVAASCIYIVCRQNNKPYMLIDFSDCLQTNVYVLGAVFLQLCNLLRLEEQPFMQKPVDPSLFIHRFADRLQFGKKMHVVSNTALRLVASMKRDWMQTGRRPSGICGAALFISAHMHGFERSKGDVVSVVHICEATLKKRLVEFECTESGSLTAEEFEDRGQEMEAQLRAEVNAASVKGSKLITEILCEHKDAGAIHFSHGLCRHCYEEFVKVSGGMQGGSAPPAFQRAELQRKEEQKRMEDVRQQLKGQGLNSDDEDEDGMPIKGKFGSAKSVLRSQNDIDVLPPKVAEFTNGGQGRGRGRGRGRSKYPNSTEDLNADTHTAEQTDFVIRGRGRGSRGRRGRDEVSKAESTRLDASENGLEKTVEQLEDDGRTRGKSRGEEAMDIPDKGPPKLRSESRIMETRRRAREAKAVSKSPSLPATDAADLGCATECASSPGSGHGEIRLESQVSGMATADNTFTTSVVDSKLGNPEVGAFESWDTGKESGELLSASRSETLTSNGVRDDDTLSDIDDDELTAYMNNDEEVRLKTIIWTEMNKEYIQEQEAKEAAQAAVEEARAAAIAAAASNSASAAELAAAAAAAVAKMKKDRKQKRLDDAKRPPAQSAAEATRQMLESKKLSTKVDYTVLAKLFDTDESHKGNGPKDCKQDEDADSEIADRSSKKIRQTDVSQADSVITQISARRSLINVVDSSRKDCTVSVVDMNEDEGVMDEEDEDMGEDGEVEVEGGLPYEYDEGDDYYDEY